MNSAAAKLTEKYQATIPAAVRKFLKLGKGDVVSFHIQKDQVVLQKLPDLDMDFYKAQQAALSEWTSPEDDALFEDL